MRVRKPRPWTPPPAAEKPEAKPDAAESRPTGEGDQAASKPTGDSGSPEGKQDEARSPRGAAKPAQPAEREIRLSEPVWSEDGSKAVLMGRAADNKDRWVFALDPASGKARTIT